MTSAGTLIWISALPLLRLFICVACGFGITKADLFPPSGARGAGQIMLNITVPSLMFSKIVPAFTSQNISALGPLVLIAVVYQLMGLGIAWTTYQENLPQQFLAILPAGGWGNYGDIPTSIAISIAGAAPFDGSPDQTLAVAYISGLSLFYMITFFPLGGHKLIALDYKGPDFEPETLRATVRKRRRAIFSILPQKITRLLSSKASAAPPVAEVDERAGNLPVIVIDEEGATQLKPEIHPTLMPMTAPSSDSHLESVTSKEGGSSELIPELSSRPVSPPPSKGRRMWVRFSSFVVEVCAPASLSIIISFPIALIHPLKSLFVEVPSPHIPSAPDGKPPLSFLFDTATFIGAASVPLGLVCLGSALARLEVPRGRWNHLPVGAILSMALGRMLLMPLLGVLVVKGLTNGGLISSQDKVLQFVCILFACLPTGTTQVFVTQVYSGTGSAEDLAAFLIPQYILMFFSMTGVIAYSLETLF
ncbi:auxin efflux carrier transmembrane protein, partial [Mycena vitilis]